MTNRVASCERLKLLLKRFEGFVDTFQFMLSAIAVTLVIANEFVTQGFNIPYIGTDWSQMQVSVRAFTWMVFVFDFVLYGLASGKPLRYARHHMLELIICITWIPYYDASLLKHVHGLLSLDALTVIGSVVHTWMVGKWTVRRFRAHPHVVIIAITLVIIATASAVLTRVEPETFHNLSDAIWFCVQTIFTVGYGDVTPKTEVGRLVATCLIVSGVGIASILIALMTKFVSARLMPDQTDPAVQLVKKVEEQSKLIAQLVDENRSTNALNRELLEELKKRSPQATEPADGSLPDGAKRGG